MVETPRLLANGTASGRRFLRDAVTFLHYRLACFLALDVPVVLRFPLTGDLGLAPSSGGQENEGGYWRTVLGSGGHPPPTLPQGLPLATPPGGHGSTPGIGVPGHAGGIASGGARIGGVRRSQNVCLRGVGSALR